MSDETDELAEMQFGLNQQLYADIVEYHKILTENVNSSIAIGMMISALSTNLGAIIAQLPDSQKERYLLLSKQILDMTVSSMIEEISFNKWGTVGHA